MDLEDLVSMCVFSVMQPGRRKLSYVSRKPGSKSEPKRVTVVLPSVADHKGPHSNILYSAVGSCAVKQESSMKSLVLGRFGNKMQQARLTT